MTPTTRSPNRWHAPTPEAPPSDIATTEGQPGQEQQTRNKPIKWANELRKAGAAGMVIWALAGAPNRDVAAPTQTPLAEASRTATTPEHLEAAHERLANARRNELNTVLDSMLISQHIKPGTPFEERSGHIPDERVRNITTILDEIAEERETLQAPIEKAPGTAYRLDPGSSGPAVDQPIISTAATASPTRATASSAGTSPSRGRRGCWPTKAIKRRSQSSWTPSSTRC